MKPVHIFEDNNGNSLLTEEAFEKAKIKFQPGIVRYERRAMALLNKHYKYQRLRVRELLLPGINLVNACSDNRANCNITKPDYVINFPPATATTKNFRVSTVKVSTKNIIDDKR